MGWLSGWNYKRPITIDNSSNSNALTDYQIRIDLDSSNFDFAKAKSDGADIRFTDSDGTTLLNYWVENWDSSGATATIWVKVLSIPAGDIKTIYMYYGNASATSESDGDNTFLFFDDFFGGTTIDTTKWNTVEGNISQGDLDSILYLRGTTGTRGRIDGKTNIPIGAAIRTYVQFHDNSNPSFSHFCSLRKSGTDNYRVDVYAGAYYILTTSNADNSSRADCSLTDTNWHKYEVTWRSGEAKFYIDDTLKAALTSNVPTIDLVATFQEGKQDNNDTYVDFVLVRKFSFPEPSANVEAEIENILRNALFYSMNF